MTTPADTDATVRDRGYLPHWERAGAIYFVTFRLADALPRHALDQLVTERRLMEVRVTQGGREQTNAERARIEIVMARRIEKYLDAGAGNCRLAIPSVAALVAGALGYFDGKRYQLYCWCVMPNHVHVVFAPVANCSLSQIVHSWKSYTATRSHKLLGTSGPFWQREYYDHLVRDERSLARIVQYVAQNPAKAGLQDWPWVYVREEPGLGEG